MASLSVSGTGLGNALQELLLAGDIVPGDPASYQLCKTILAYHPLGLKMTRGPVVAALSKPRKISVPDGPEDQCVKAFEDAWRALDVDRRIIDVMTLARAYGAAAVVAVIEGDDPSEPIDLRRIADHDLTFNVLDPLNVSGTIVGDLDPNSPQFLRARPLVSNGVAYHKSRSVVMFNEQPIYLSYTPSAFGFAGRSVYQRALFPMKTYIQTMLTDDLISRKAGVIVAKLKATGSIVDNMVEFFNRKKREILKEAQVGNVINISSEDGIETLNLQNAEGPMQAARKNCIENIATAADMPAKLLNQETFAEGFGEGTEDAKAVVRYLHSLRREMQPLFEYFDRIVQYRAWNEDFFYSIQRLYPEEYGRLTHDQAFYRWSNSFTASWPELIEEPESKKIEVEKTKFDTVVSTVSALIDRLDPANKAALLEWAQDCLNGAKHLFPSPLSLDFDALEAHLAEAEAQVAEAANQMEELAADPAPFRIAAE
ncbi:MAG: DUF1073 domain-containing protein [Methylocystis sp.]|nr:DUF1073 domain-containing protein [Methylocystis sp.]